MSVPQEVCLRNKFMRFSLWTSVLTFCVIEGYALQDQLAIGHASAIYMIGTACVAAGACIGLFAFLITIGLVISALNPTLVTHTCPPELGRLQRGLDAR
jgi:hypothetical protein